MSRQISYGEEPSYMQCVYYPEEEAAELFDPWMKMAKASALVAAALAFISFIILFLACCCKFSKPTFERWLLWMYIWAAIFISLAFLMYGGHFCKDNLCKVAEGSGYAISCFLFYLVNANTVKSMGQPPPSDGNNDDDDKGDQYWYVYLFICHWGEDEWSNRASFLCSLSMALGSFLPTSPFLNLCACVFFYDFLLLTNNTQLLQTGTTTTMNGLEGLVEEAMTVVVIVMMTRTAVRLMNTTMMSTMMTSTMMATSAMDASIAIKALMVMALMMMMTLKTLMMSLTKKMLTDRKEMVLSVVVVVAAQVAAVAMACLMKYPMGAGKTHRTRWIRAVDPISTTPTTTTTT